MTSIPTIPALVAAVCLLAPALSAEDSSAQAAMGVKVFAENCNRCHEAPDAGSRNIHDWKAISLHMRLFADISRKEQQQVLAYLERFNTPKKD